MTYTAERIKMKINSKDFQMRPGTKVKLKEWPTTMKPICKSKKRYRKLLEAHVAELSSLQQLHYASHRYGTGAVDGVGPGTGRSRRSACRRNRWRFRWEA